MKKKSFFSGGFKVGVRRRRFWRGLWQRIDWRGGAGKPSTSAPEPPALTPRMTAREIRQLTRQLLKSVKDEQT